uniref:Ig-like domain-containing protein n=1 Tax=Haplochromis burtoni TaxID=8153 RepID=A0A3Q2V6D1_HAPBU
MLSVALLMLLSAVVLILNLSQNILGFFTGVKREQLTQPASMLVQPGQHLTITCQVSYSLSSYYTAWIRQPAGKALEWMSDDETVKDSLKNKFCVELDSSSNTVTLKGQNLQPEDTAVYYCARRRATVTQPISRPEQKHCASCMISSSRSTGPLRLMKRACIKGQTLEFPVPVSFDCPVECFYLSSQPLSTTNLLIFKIQNMSNCISLQLPFKSVVIRIQLLC